MTGKCYGATDVGTALCHREAARVALTSLTFLNGGSLAFDAVWTSDLARCQGLAEALAAGLAGSFDVRVDTRLRELDHGSFEGRAWDELHANEPAVLEHWGANWQAHGPPRGESAETLERRVRAWMADLDATKRHLLVGHAGVMRAVLVVHQGLDWPAAMTTKVAHLTAIELA